MCAQVGSSLLALFVPWASPQGCSPHCAAEQAHVKATEVAKMVGNTETVIVCNINPLLTDTEQKLIYLCCLFFPSCQSFVKSLLYLKQSCCLQLGVVLASTDGSVDPLLLKKANQPTKKGRGGGTKPTTNKKDLKQASPKPQLTRLPPTGAESAVVLRDWSGLCPSQSVSVLVWCTAHSVFFPVAFLGLSKLPLLSCLLSAPYPALARVRVPALSPRQPYQRATSWGCGSWSLPWLRTGCVVCTEA